MKFFSEHIKKYKVNFYATTTLIILTIVSYIITFIKDVGILEYNIGFIYAFLANSIVLLALQAFIGSIPDMNKFEEVISYKPDQKSQESRLKKYSISLRIFYYKPSKKLRISLVLIGAGICTLLYVLFGTANYNKVLLLVVNIISCLAIVIFFVQSHVMYSVIRHLEGDESV